MIYGDFLKSKVPTRKHKAPKVTIDQLQRHLLGLVGWVFALVKGMGTFRGPVSGWSKVARAKVPIDQQGTKKPTRVSGGLGRSGWVSRRSCLAGA